MPADPVQYPPVRRLGLDDLAACTALAVNRGWAAERSKWALLIEASEAFGIDAPDGALAGAVVLTRWGPDFASVGMMLVAARHARRGLGRALMEHLLAAAGDATVTLYATDMGRPLYEKLGFKPVRRNVGMVGWFRAPEAGRSRWSPLRDPYSAAAHGSAQLIREATEQDSAGILGVDRAAFGADRSAILTRLPGFAERIVVLEDGTRGDGPGIAGPGIVGPGIVGWAAAWRNGVNTVIGPVVAPDTSGARRLIGALAWRARGQVRLDLDPDRPELPAWAQAHGLRPVSANDVMARGDYTQRGTPSRLHTPISIALA